MGASINSTAMAAHACHSRQPPRHLPHYSPLIQPHKPALTTRTHAGANPRYPYQLFHLISIFRHRRHQHLRCHSYPHHNHPPPSSTGTPSPPLPAATTSTTTTTPTSPAANTGNQIPHDFVQTAEHWDNRQVFGLNLPRCIQATPHAIQNKTAGLPVATVLLLAFLRPSWS